MLYRCGGSDPVSPRRVAGEYKVGKGDIGVFDHFFLWLSATFLNISRDSSTHMQRRPNPSKYTTQIPSHKRLATSGDRELVETMQNWCFPLRISKLVHTPTMHETVSGVAWCWSIVKSCSLSRTLRIFWQNWKMFKPKDVRFWARWFATLRSLLQ